MPNARSTCIRSDSTSNFTSLKIITNDSVATVVDKTTKEQRNSPYERFDLRGGFAEAVVNNTEKSDAVDISQYRR